MHAFTIEQQKHFNIAYVSRYVGRFIKNFGKNTICKITQEPLEGQRYNIVPVGSSASLVLDQLMSKIIHFTLKPRFDRLATASTSTSP